MPYKSPEKERECQRRWQQAQRAIGSADPSTWSSLYWADRTRLWKKQGIKFTRAGVLKLWKRQGGRCFVTGRPIAGKRWVLEHNHTTGVIRGIASRFGNQIMEALDTYGREETINALKVASQRLPTKSCKRRAGGI